LPAAGYAGLTLSELSFTSATEQAVSSQRQIDRLRAPLIVTHVTNDTP
jgi:hypothetical protein